MMERLEESAIIVQTHVRGTLARMQIKHMKDGRDYAPATMIQSAYRGDWLKRVEVLKKKNMIKCLNSAVLLFNVRGRKVARNHANKLRQERDDLLREQAAHATVYGDRNWPETNFIHYVRSA